MLLEQEILRDDRPHATVTRQSRDRDDQVQQRDQDTCHVRVSVGQPSAAAQRCRIVYSAPKLAIRDPQAERQFRQAVTARPSDPRNFDVTPDGQRVIAVADAAVANRSDSSPDDVISVVLNWVEELKARVPAK